MVLVDKNTDVNLCIKLVNLNNIALKTIFKKKFAFIPSFPCEKFFSEKKKLRKEANTKQEIFFYA